MTQMFRHDNCPNEVMVGIYRRTVYYTKKQLLKQKDRSHVDYICPECNNTVICNSDRHCIPIR